MQVPIKNEYFDAILPYIRNWELKNEPANYPYLDTVGPWPVYSLWIEVYVPQALKLDVLEMEKHFHAWSVDHSCKGYTIFSGVIRKLEIAEYLYGKLQDRKVTVNECTVNGAPALCIVDKNELGYTVKLLPH